MRVTRLATLIVLATTLGACSSGAPAATPLPAGVVGAASGPDPTPLQQHVLFFDRNHDGKLEVAETKAGLRALGVSGFSSGPTAFAIHAGLASSMSAGGLTLDVAKVHRGKHKSDTDIYDAEGRFVPAAFEKLMAYDTNHSNSLAWPELKAMIAKNKETFATAKASEVEFGLLLKLGSDVTETVDGKPEPGLSRARLTSFYDGSLFYKIAATFPKAEALGEDAPGIDTTGLHAVPVGFPAPQD